MYTAQCGSMGGLTLTFTRPLEENKHKHIGKTKNYPLGSLGSAHGAASLVRSCRAYSDRTSSNGVYNP